jgi:hypothetical protein
MDYVKINIDDIKLDMIKFKKINDDKSNGIKYTILYNGNPFYIIPSSPFENYGIKSFSNTNKITIILDHNIHKSYINLINYLYNKMEKHVKIKNLNIDIVNPISTISNNTTLDININNFKNISTNCFEYTDNGLKSISVKKLHDRQYIIAPLLYIYQLNSINNKLYFNFLVHECYIKFYEPCLPLSEISKIFNHNINMEEHNVNDEDDDELF